MCGRAKKNAMNALRRSLRQLFDGKDSDAVLQMASLVNIDELCAKAVHAKDTDAALIVKMRAVVEHMRACGVLSLQRWVRAVMSVKPYTQETWSVLQWYDVNFARASLHEVFGAHWAESKRDIVCFAVHWLVQRQMDTPFFLLCSVLYWYGVQLTFTDNGQEESL